MAETDKKQGAGGLTEVNFARTRYDKGILGNILGNPRNLVGRYNIMTSKGSDEVFRRLAIENTEDAAGIEKAHVQLQCGDGVMHKATLHSLLQNGEFNAMITRLHNAINDAGSPNDTTMITMISNSSVGDEGRSPVLAYHSNPLEVVCQTVPQVLDAVAGKAKSGAEK